MKISIFILIAVHLVLASCAVRQADSYFHPYIIEQGVDMQQYEKDRSACENKIRSNPSNYDLADKLHFRMCVYDKGYKFMS
jgi:hypothetical protein